MAGKSKNQSGGVNIDRVGSLRVDGDIIGRDKITTTQTPAAGADSLEQQFARIVELIDRRPADPNLDKEEVRAIVERILQEVRKGEAANPTKVARWLDFLAGMADDVFQVTVAALAHPVAGVAKAIQVVARRAGQGGG